jgi:DNA-binding response OmpR family regulator
MKRLLLVDDDPLVLRTYRDRLSAFGFQVNTAVDGAAAMTFLRSAKPDLVVLDLMMPNVTGVDVLRFIRSEPRLAPTPVVVLTNAYMNDLGRQAAALGLQKALLKAQCTPQALMGVIDEILQAASASTASAERSAAASPRDNTAPAAQPARSQAPTAAAPEATGAEAKVAAELQARAGATCAELSKLYLALARAPAGPEQQVRLQDFYLKVHFLTAAAGLAEFRQLAQMAAVFEALLYVLMDRPAHITPSVIRTLASLVDFTEFLFRHSRRTSACPPLAASVLVVDDDPLSNRLVVSALRQAQLNARSTEDPLIAWQWANSEPYDLVLLDIEMPGLSGFELCQRLRALDGYAKTPIIYVTGHADFENRAKGTLTGGDDMIAKPILPMELAAKVVMHLLKRQLQV